MCLARNKTCIMDHGPREPRKRRGRCSDHSAHGIPMAAAPSQATILSQVGACPRCVFFWKSLSHSLNTQISGLFSMSGKDKLPTASGSLVPVWNLSDF